MLTRECTNNCSYCFARDLMGQAPKQILSEEGVEKFIEFLKKHKRKTGSKLKGLNIMGGEPFLYKNLSTFIKKVETSDTVIKWCILTGGVFPTKNVEYIPNRSSILFNLNERRNYKSNTIYDLVIKNLETLIDEKECSVGLGYNISQLDFNGKEIIRIAKRFGITRLRIAIANPIYNSDTATVVHPEKYSLLASEVFTFIKLCDRNGIRVYMDCRIPFCFFTEKQIGWLMRNGHGIAEAMQSCLCGGPIVVSPDLKVSKCSSFSMLSEDLSFFSSKAEIINWAFHSIDSKFGIPDIYPECKQCKHNTYCSGGCPAWKKDFLNNLDEADQRYRIKKAMVESIEIYKEYLKTGDSQSLERFKKTKVNVERLYKALPSKTDGETTYLLSLYYGMVGDGKEKTTKRKAIYFGYDPKFL